MTDTAVLIAGAGPTGLSLAVDLARRGVRVRIIDRAAEYPAGSRGKGLQPRSQEVLHDLGVGPDLWRDSFAGLPRRHYQRGHEAMESPADGDPRADTRFPLPLIIPQWRIEQLLRARLAAAGITVELGNELVEFHQDAELVTARTASGDRITARYLVGCDGARSTVRKALGIGFRGESRPEERMLIGDVEVRGLARDHWHMWYDDAGWLALCPFAGTDSWQVQAVLPPDADGTPRQPSLDVFRTAVAEITGRPEIELDNLTWSSVYRVNERMVDRFRAGRVFLAGDAAHAHSPAGGLGMNTGIQDAYNLGWKLGLVLSHLAGPELLDSYQAERLPVAAWTLDISGRRLRAIAASAGTQGGFDAGASPETGQLGLGYRDSALAVDLAQGPVRAGDRAPDAELKSTGGRVHDLLEGTGFTLLGFGASCRDAVDELAGSELVHAHLIPPDETEAWERYGIDADTLVLVRPDGYLGLVAPGSRPGAIGEYFTESIGVHGEIP